MSLMSTHIVLDATSRAETVIDPSGAHAWMRIYIAGKMQDTLTVFPAGDVSPEKMAAFVDAFNDIMTSPAPAQNKEAA